MRLVSCKFTKRKAWIASYSNRDLVVISAEKNFYFKVTDSSMLFKIAIGQRKLLLNDKSLPHLLIAAVPGSDSLFEDKLIFRDSHRTCCVAFVELAESQLSHTFVSVPWTIADR